MICEDFPFFHGSSNSLLILPLRDFLFSLEFSEERIIIAGTKGNNKTMIILRITSSNLFCKKNETMPYAFKSKVLEAMLVSSLLYGSETWLSGSVKEIEKMYVSAVKSALGVRDTTRNDAALIEAGRPSIQELVEKRTTNFMKKEFFADRTVDTPLMKIFKICKSKRTNGYTYLSRLLDPSRHHNVTVRERFITQNTSKAATYK